MRIFAIAALCGMCAVLSAAPTKSTKKQQPQEQQPISSGYNYTYSITRPSEERFVELISKNKGRVANTTIQKAYENPMSSPQSALIYAIAHDYTLGDGGDDVLQAYQSAAYAGTDFLGKRGYLEYADFLLRTKRYDMLIDGFDANICYQNKPQCAYYIVAAKYLRDNDCSRENFNDAYKFSLMRGMVVQMCRDMKPSKK